MTSTLVLDTRNAMGRARAKADLAAIDAIAPDGFVLLDDDVVDRIAMLLDHASLSNGESVAAFSYDEDDDTQTLVCAFGPALLSTQDQDYVRDRLAQSANGRQACRLFDEAIRRRIKIRLCGGDISLGARIVAVQLADDEVEINRGDAAMVDMMETLGLGAHVVPTRTFGEIDFDVFSKAVFVNADRCGPYARPLRQLAGSGHRQGATHVTWG